MKTTQDKLLNGRISVRQPARGEGYRIAVDTILVAAAVPAQNRQTILDLGCGVGGIMLALAARLSSCLISGLELQEPLANLCRINIQENGYSDRASVICGSVAALPAGFASTFDHVVMNPPFHPMAGHTESPIPTKGLAHREAGEGDLPLWLDAAAAALKTGGILTLIHRFDRLETILESIASNFGEIKIKPVLSKAGIMPKRVILRASKVVNAQNSQPEFRPAFTLYGTDAKYSEEGEAILRHIKAMEI